MNTRIGQILVNEALCSEDVSSTDAQLGVLQLGGGSTTDTTSALLSRQVGLP